MRRTHQLPISYYQTELQSNMSRFKKLIDLESQLIIKDYTQGKLQGKVNTLKAENQLLRKRLLGGQPSISQSKCTKQKNMLRESAFERANAVLYQPRKNQAMSHTFYNKQLSHHELRDSQQKAKENRYSRTFKDLSATKAFSNGERSNSAAQLSKNAYMRQSQQQRHFSSVYQLSQGNNQNQHLRKKSTNSINPEYQGKMKAQAINNTELFKNRKRQFVSEPEEKIPLKTLVNELNFSILGSRKEREDVAQSGITNNLSRKRKHFLSVITLPKKKQPN